MSLNCERLYRATTSEIRVWISLRCSGVNRFQIASSSFGDGIFPMLLQTVLFVENPTTDNDPKQARTNAQIN